MKKRTFDEMISHFNIAVSEMQITQKQKMELLGMITAIAMKHNESVKHGHWIDKFGGEYRCSSCRKIVCIDDEVEFPNGISYDYCPHCGALMMPR